MHATCRMKFEITILILRIKRFVIKNSCSNFLGQLGLFSPRSEFFSYLYGLVLHLWFRGLRLFVKGNRIEYGDCGFDYYFYSGMLEILVLEKQWIGSGWVRYYSTRLYPQLKKTILTIFKNTVLKLCKF